MSKTFEMLSDLICHIISFKTHPSSPLIWLRGCEENPVAYEDSLQFMWATLPGGQAFDLFSEKMCSTES